MTYAVTQLLAVLIFLVYAATVCFLMQTYFCRPDVKMTRKQEIVNASSRDVILEILTCQFELALWPGQYNVTGMNKYLSFLDQGVTVCVYVLMTRKFKVLPKVLPMYTDLFIETKFLIDRAKSCSTLSSSFPMIKPSYLYADGM